MTDLSAAIERVILTRTRLKAIIPSAVLSATTLPEALALGGNGPAVAAFDVWQAIGALEAAWDAVLAPGPVARHSADRPVSTEDDGCLACQ